MFLPGVFLCGSTEFNISYKNMNIIKILNPFLIQNLRKIKRTNKSLSYLPSVRRCLTFNTLSRFTILSARETVNNSTELWWTEKTVNLLKLWKVKHPVTDGRYARFLSVFLILPKFCIRKGFKICIIFMFL